MVLFDRQAWRWFLLVARPLFQSDRRWQALAMLTLLIVLLFSISGANVASSFVQQFFMTALAAREESAFYRWGLLYVGMFALLTLLAVSYRFTEDRLGLFWRQWLTTYFIGRYLAGQTYQRLVERSDIDNPDQRIAEDVRNFTATTLSFVLIVFNATITVASFSGVLWAITPWLFVAAVCYAASGSFVTMLVGRRLTALNVAQLKKEADFRFGLMQVRDHADVLALEHDEARQSTRLSSLLSLLVENFKRIIAVNRNLGSFTTGFNYLTPVIPILIVAPLYMRGEVEFGVVTQATTAFTFVLGAFSVFITEFQRISAFAAVITRLGTLWEATEPPSAGCTTGVVLEIDPDRLAVEDLTLCSTPQHEVVIQNVSFELPPGGRLVVTGPSASGKTLLLRAIAGSWRIGSGVIRRPDASDVMLLAGEPYLFAGRLGDQLACFDEARTLADPAIERVVDETGLRSLVDRQGRLDATNDWSSELSPRERQLVALARLLLCKPKLALLDGATSKLNGRLTRRIYELLAKSGIAVVSVNYDADIVRFHQFELHLEGDGGWELRSVGGSGGDPQIVRHEPPLEGGRHRAADAQPLP